MECHFPSALLIPFLLLLSLILCELTFFYTIDEEKNVLLKVTLGWSERDVVVFVDLYLGIVFFRLQPFFIILTF